MLYIGKKDFYVIFGYWEKYGEDSFYLIIMFKEGEEFLFKLMNCLYYCEIFGYCLYFYCDLLFCIVEFGMVYCYEQSGELYGFLCVCGFMQDDVYIFCMLDQFKDEFLNVFDLIKMVFFKMGFVDFIV